MRKKSITLPTQPTEYPAGTYVHTELGYFYIHSPVKRFRIISYRVLDSWAPPRVVETTEAAVKKYKITAKMKFRNGSLIWNLADGKLYLIENGLRCWVKNPDWLSRLGVDSSDLKFVMNKVKIVSEAELKLHEPGRNLD